MKKILKLLITTFFLLLGSGTLMGCQTGYVIKSSYYQLKMLSKKESYDNAMADPRIDNETKRKIKLVQDVKKFAEDKIDLVHTKNYDSFVLLEDKYVVYAVTGAYQDRLEAYTWWFPIVGTVPYKGFFKRADAVAETTGLEKLHFDASMRALAPFQL